MDGEDILETDIAVGCMSGERKTKRWIYEVIDWNGLGQINEATRLTHDLDNSGESLHFVIYLSTGEWQTVA